eukprot:scaffold25450_cov117-Cylindrotheca_fusiformis.AAC.2
MSCIRGSNPGPPHYECGAITSYANAALQMRQKFKIKYLIENSAKWTIDFRSMLFHSHHLKATGKVTNNIQIAGNIGDKKKSKKKRKAKHKLAEEAKKQKAVSDRSSDEEDMTEAEKRAHKFKMERQRQESEAIAKKSHRERVEELNEKLGSLTEHNDIPRVSAAGNG